MKKIFVLVFSLICWYATDLVAQQDERILELPKKTVFSKDFKYAVTSVNEDNAEFELIETATKKVLLKAQSIDFSNNRNNGLPNFSKKSYRLEYYSLSFNTNATHLIFLNRQGDWLNIYNIKEQRYENRISLKDWGLYSESSGSSKTPEFEVSEKFIIFNPTTNPTTTTKLVIFSIKGIHYKTIDVGNLINQEYDDVDAFLYRDDYYIVKPLAKRKQMIFVYHTFDFRLLFSKSINGNTPHGVGKNTIAYWIKDQKGISHYEIINLDNGNVVRETNTREEADLFYQYIGMDIPTKKNIDASIELDKSGKSYFGNTLLMRNKGEEIINIKENIFRFDEAFVSDDERHLVVRVVRKEGGKEKPFIWLFKL
jgi:hypothetical protein